MTDTIERRSLEAKAADAIRKRIVSGELAQGTRLTEVGLARQFGLSRGPVRAALQQLAAEHLVLQRPYSGWEVRQLSDEDAWELNTLRSALEALGAQLAAERIDDLGIARLKAARKALRKACADGRMQVVTDADFALHRTIIDLSGHQRLKHAYLLLEQQIRAFITAVNTPVREVARVARSHDALVAAICVGDAAAAGQLAAHHNIALARQLSETKKSRSRTS